MEEVKCLVMNIKDMNHLTTAYRGEKFDVWETLQGNCAELVLLVIVIDGSVRKKMKDKIWFRQLVVASGVNPDEFCKRYRKLTQALVSLIRAQENNGLWRKQLVVHLASIDQTKELPIKD
jgi:hypothetical protein